jgi:hypothetical protein
MRRFGIAVAGLVVVLAACSSGGSDTAAPSSTTTTTTGEPASAAARPVEPAPSPGCESSAVGAGETE